MALPDILLKKRQGGLGRQQPTDDGVSALITTGPAIAGKLDQNRAYELRSLVAAEALGITAASVAYAALHYQLSEFYRLSPGAVLLLMVSDAVSLADMADRTKAYGKKLLQGANGRVKQIGFYLSPAAGGATAGFVADVVPAIAKAQALADEEFEQHRPILCLLAGHGLPVDLTTLPDLTTKLAPSVGVVVGTDNLLQPDEPAIGALLGMVSAVQVHICIGWIEGCQLRGDGSFENAGISNGVANADLLPGDLAALNDKGYIVVIQHPGADGFFFADSPTCIGKDSDYCQIENVRTINKMARLVRQALLPQLKGPLLLQADGTLQPQVLGELEEKGANALTVNMGRTNELSALEVYIDPAQVLSSSTGNTPLKVGFSGVPVGVSRAIEATIGLVTKI
jgi:hypothetical protein